MTDEQPAAPIDPENWAAKPVKDLIAALVAKERLFFEYVNRRGFGLIWRESFAQHYGLDPNWLGTWQTQRLGFDGDDNEQIRFRVNETRSYTTQLVNMAIGQRPAFQVMALNSDYSTLARIDAGDACVTALYESAAGESKERSTVERGNVFGSAHTWVRWDPLGGDTVAVPQPVMGPDGQPAINPQTGQPLTQNVDKPTGEILVSSRYPWQVISEPYIEDETEHLWKMVHDRRSRWEVAAAVTDPALRERVLKIPSSENALVDPWLGFDGATITNENITVRHFYYKRCKSLPAGRYVIFAGDIPIYDGPMPYPRIPVIPFVPSKYMGTAFGYSKVWDCLPINLMFDQILSDLASAVANFGRPNLVVDEGTDYDLDAIANGNRVLTKQQGSEMPQFTEPPPLPPLSQWLVGFLEQRFQSVTMINSVTRGDPQSNIKSGQMAALFHSIAIEAMSAEQTAVDMHREDIANFLLEIAQTFVWHPLILAIAGQEERQYLGEFGPDAFAGFKSVKVKTANPMQRTQAGRLEIATTAMQLKDAHGMPVIQTVDQMMEIFRSGTMKPVFRSSKAAELRWTWETEALAKGPAVQMVPDPAAPPDMQTGQPGTRPTVPTVPVLVTDHPVNHILDHLINISSRSVMETPEGKAVVAATMAHVADHMYSWRNMDPAMAALLGFPAPPAPMMQAEDPNADPNAQPANGAHKPTPKAMTPSPQQGGPETQSLGVKLPSPSTSPMEHAPTQ